MVDPSKCRSLLQLRYAEIYPCKISVNEKLQNSRVVQFCVGEKCLLRSLALAAMPPRDSEKAQYSFLDVRLWAARQTQQWPHLSQRRVLGCGLFACVMGGGLCGHWLRRRGAILALIGHFLVIAKMKDHDIRAAVLGTASVMAL
jgi:hypothetical protein